MTDGSPYTKEDRERWRQAILAKGQEVASKLEKIKAGKDVKLSDIKLFKNDEPAETEEKRLRRFFDHLMARLRKVDAPQFGYDPDKGAFWTVAALDEMPWADLAP